LSEDIFAQDMEQDTKR